MGREPKKLLYKERLHKVQLCDSPLSDNRGGSTFFIIVERLLVSVVLKTKHIQARQQMHQD